MEICEQLSSLSAQDLFEVLKAFGRHCFDIATIPAVAPEAIVLASRTVMLVILSP